MKRLLIILTFMSSLQLFAQNAQEEPQVNRITQQEDNKVKFYPNPATENLNVIISNYTLKSPVITIYSLIGNIVKTEIESNGVGKYKINTENLPAGYYFFAISDNELKYKKTYKFLKR